MCNKYVDVLLPISNKEVDRAFSYKASTEILSELNVGQRVLVPFGKGGKKYEAYVIGFRDKLEIDDSILKSIISIIDTEPIFNENMLLLAKWMSEKYFTSLYNCLKCMLPKGIGFEKDMAVRVVSSDQLKVTDKQKMVLNFIGNFTMLLSEVENEFGREGLKSIKVLEKKGNLEIFEVYKNKNLTLKMKYVYLNYDLPNFEEACKIASRKSSIHKKIIELLSENEQLAVTDVRKLLKISVSPIRTLESKGLIEIEEQEVLRSTLDYDSVSETDKPTLTEEQEMAVNKILSDTSKKPTLIFGVTGSGKTEIYMRIIEDCLNFGKDAIVLVPEISLTPQTVNTFVSRFGKKVLLTHSRMSLGERFDQWKMANSGGGKVMIGPRSAVFTPFRNLGVIIIDEEHEKTYKSEIVPKYCAKEVAIERGEIENAKVIMGSATPTIESYYKATNGELNLITISKRVNENLPKISIVDMREEFANGNASIFSLMLQDAINEKLAKKEQIILFLNRRGFSTFVSCRTCGYVMKCENCNVNYTYHKASSELICHYCGRKISIPNNCPTCGSKYIKYFGVGTQRVEDEVQKLFNGVKTLRMDLDTTKGKRRHEAILNDFKNGFADILIGTQMIAKGLDFPNVTLVGIVAPDIALNNGDFRAGETAFDLLCQVSGRAGRGAKSGNAIIQTYNPEHYAITYAETNDYLGFYEHEISLRRQMNYPPFSNIFNVLFTCENEKELIVAINKFVEVMNFYNRNDNYEILGPAPCMVSKIRKRYRWQVIIKALDEEKLKKFVVYSAEKYKGSYNTNGINISLTPNPVMLL